MIIEAAGLYSRGSGLGKREVDLGFLNEDFGLEIGY
jgi:hypothetical protein